MEAEEVKREERSACLKVTHLHTEHQECRPALRFAPKRAALSVGDQVRVEKQTNATYPGVRKFGLGLQNEVNRTPAPPSWLPSLLRQEHAQTQTRIHTHTPPRRPDLVSFLCISLEQPQKGAPRPQERTASYEPQSKLFNARVSAACSRKAVIVFCSRRTQRPASAPERHSIKGLSLCWCVGAAQNIAVSCFRFFACAPGSSVPLEPRICKRKGSH